MKSNKESEQVEEKGYRRKEFKEEGKQRVKIGKKTVFRLKPKKFYFSF